MIGECIDWGVCVDGWVWLNRGRVAPPPPTEYVMQYTPRTHNSHINAQYPPHTQYTTHTHTIYLYPFMYVSLYPFMYVSLYPFVSVFLYPGGVGQVPLPTWMSSHLRSAAGGLINFHWTGIKEVLSTCMYGTT